MIRVQTILVLRVGVINDCPKMLCEPLLCVFLHFFTSYSLNHQVIDCSYLTAIIWITHLLKKLQCTKGQNKTRKISMETKFRQITQPLFATRKKIQYSAITWVQIPSQIVAYNLTPVIFESEL